MLGAAPPVWDHDSQREEGSTNEAANEMAHVVASMRVQRLSHASETWWLIHDGTSRGLDVNMRRHSNQTQLLWKRGTKPTSHLRSCRQMAAR